ncbi:MAG: hypothetical protein EOO59_07020, partial [Hymenobacter sp.]
MKQGILLIGGLGGLLLGQPGFGQQAPGPAAGAPRAQGLVLTGTVRDAQGRPLELVVLSVEGQPGGATTTAQGTFALRLPLPARPDAPLVLVVRHINYQTLRQPLRLPA